MFAGDSHLKVTEMLVVSREVVDYSFWSHCLGRKSIILTPYRYRLGYKVVIER